MHRYHRRTYMTARRKRTAAALVTAFVLLFTSVFGAQYNEVSAASVQSGSGRVDASAGAVLRASAGTSSSRLALLSDGSALVIEEEVFTEVKSTRADSRWFKVRAGGRSGYVRADLVKDTAFTPVSAKTTTALNYRSGAGTSMPLKGTLAKGKTVNVLLKAKARGTNDTWYMIGLNGRQYYVCAKWVKLVEAKKSKEDNGRVSYSRQDITSPKTLSEGSPFTLKGRITANYKITAAKAGVVTDDTRKWVISTEICGNSKSFNISKVDTLIKFGTLTPGKYRYRLILTINGKDYSVINRAFRITRADRAQKITAQAFAMAWPAGTSKSVYSYSTGKAKPAYASALDKAYPSRGSWGKPPRAGASCDVFVGTALRASGVDLSAPRGLAEQFTYYKNSDKYITVKYTGDRSQLRSGDIIVYKRKNATGAHTCLYLIKDGREYIAEANYNSTYGILQNSGSAIDYRLTKSNKKSIAIYRIKESTTDGDR